MMKKIVIGLLILCHLAGCGVNTPDISAPTESPALKYEAPEAYMIPEPGKDEPAVQTTAKPGEGKESPVETPNIGAAKSEGTVKGIDEPKPGEVPSVSGDPAQDKANDTKEAVKDTVSLKIYGLSGQEILSREIEYGDGLTAFSLLKNAEGVTVMSSGSGKYAYITGINDLKEKANGPMSGWIYKVNGESPGIGAGQYQLKSGDKVEWIYKTD
jgi:hypothetical protein